MTFRPTLKDIVISIAFLAMLGLLIVTGVWAWREFMHTPPYVDPARYPVAGIDVSAHNGRIEMDSVAKSGIRFVFIKASEGKSMRDPRFASNYNNAVKAGLKTGAYHFFRFDVDGMQQARNFLNAIGNREFDLGLAIDVEDSYNAPAADHELIVTRLMAMAEILRLNGHRVLFYSNRKGFSDYILPAGEEDGNLWICSFNSTPINAEWTFWQYNHHGHVRGIKGDVDLNVFCGSEADFERYLQGAKWPYEDGTP